jgi:hypothetical protein
MWTSILAVIGVITGVISILVLVFGLGSWKKGIEDDVSQIKTDVAGIKGELKEHNLSSFCMMVQTLWDVYVIDTLHKRPDIASSHSLPKLTQKGLDYIPEDVKEQLNKSELSVKDQTNISSGYLVVQIIGLDRITKLAQENDLSIQEMIAVLSAYLWEKLGA